MGSPAYRSPQRRALVKLPARVLVVDGDARSADMLTFTLTRAGCSAEVVSAAWLSAEMADVGQGWDVALARLDQPAVEVAQIGRAFDRLGVAIPLVVLSQSRRIDDMVASFEAGATDYLRLPAHPRELVARIRTVLRWRLSIPSLGNSAPVQRRQGFTLDPVSMTVQVPTGHVVPLTPCECRLLHCLMRQTGRLVTRQAILEQVWESDEGSGKQIDVYIGRLRRKLEGYAASPLIETVYGCGYRLVGR